MTVMNKKEYEQIISAYGERQRVLTTLLQQRPLRSSSEGCAKGHWATPEQYVAFMGNAQEVRMALADFRTVLKELELMVK